tara:strand:+ start:1687 stop:2031 length:345 start_codon:yes stop_codon:yes gene_type:complete
MASEMKIRFGICELGSECEVCVERFEFTFVAEYDKRRVVAIGYDKGGKQIWREHNGCQMENITNWRCTGFHGDYVSRNGLVTLEKNSKTYYNFKNLEICNFPVDEIEEQTELIF